MKIKQAILILLTLTVSCTNEKPTAYPDSEEESVEEQKEIDESIEEVNEEPMVDNIDLEELFGLLDSGDLYTQLPIEREDSSFTLKFENGEKTFQSIYEPSDGIQAHKFLGVKKSIGFYLVNVQFYEGGQTYLIDQQTGTSYTLWSEPIFSPNDSLLITESAAGMEGTPVGYQLWKLYPDRKWIKIVEVNQNNWSPLGIRWISDSEFLLKKEIFGGYYGLVEESNEPFVPYEIIKVK